MSGKIDLIGTNRTLKEIADNLSGALRLRDDGADIPAVTGQLIESSLELVQGLLGLPEGASQEVPADLQNRIINAVEKARSAKLAAGYASLDYQIGHGEAKRDVLIELAKVFSGEDLKG